jgi:nucleoside-diphosphate-sugar epimerase
VHVRDIARATAALLAAPADEISGEAFNIGSEEQNYRIRDLAEIVHRRLPECEVAFAGDASPDPRSYRVDFTRFASRFPGFACEWTAERGADELADAYERAGLTLADFEGERFIRLSRLKRLLDASELDGGLRWTRSRSSDAA